MQICGILNSIIPVGVGQVSIREKCSCSFNECVIHALSNSIVLGSVSGRHLVFDSTFAKELLHAFACIFASTTGAEGFDMCTGLEFHTCDKGHEVAVEITFVLKTANIDLVQLVINER